MQVDKNRKKVVFYTKEEGRKETKKRKNTGNDGESIELLHAS